LFISEWLSIFFVVFGQLKSRDFFFELLQGMFSEIIKNHQISDNYFWFPPHTQFHVLVHMRWNWYYLITIDINQLYSKRCIYSKRCSYFFKEHIVIRGFLSSIFWKLVERLLWNLKYVLDLHESFKEMIWVFFYWFFAKKRKIISVIW